MRVAKTEESEQNRGEYSAYRLHFISPLSCLLKATVAEIQSICCISLGV